MSLEEVIDSLRSDLNELSLKDGVKSFAFFLKLIQTGFSLPIGLLQVLQLLVVCGIVAIAKLASVHQSLLDESISLKIGSFLLVTEHRLFSLYLGLSELLDLWELEGRLLEDFANWDRVLLVEGLLGFPLSLGISPEQS